MLGFDGDADFGEEGEGDDEEGEFGKDGGVALGGDVFLKNAEDGDGSEDEEEAFVGGDPHDEHETGDGGTFPFREGAEGMAAVELENREEIEEVDPSAELGNGGADGSAGGVIDTPGSERSTESPDGAGEADFSVFMRTGRVLLEANECAEARDEHGSSGADAVAAKHPDVAHFVNVDGEDNSERKFPTPGGPVNAEAQDHGEKGARLGEAEEKELGLGEDEDREEFELPKEQSDYAQCTTGLGPFGFGMCVRRLRRGIDLPNELFDFLPDDSVLI